MRTALCLKRLPIGSEKAFHDLFGDEVTLVLINPGKRSDWFFGRYRIPWTTVRASAVAPLLEQLQVKHAPKFILMDEKGTNYDQTELKIRLI